MNRTLRMSIALLLCLALGISLAACSPTANGPAAEPTPGEATTAPTDAPQSAGKFVAGKYEGEANGFGGLMKVSVEVDENAILSVEVTENAETTGIGSNAVDKLPPAIVEAQSLAVDVISGCTISSGALLAAVESALVKAGADVTSLYEKAGAGAALPAAEDATTDIVVIGGGGAGMAAAMEAKNQGKDVILVEKLAMLGGTTALASTAFNAGGSSVQMAMNPPFTADDYYKKLIGTGSDDPLMRVMADRSGADVDWLIDMGADMSRVINGSQHTPADGSAYGSMLVAVLTKQVGDLQIDCRLQTKATELVTDGDKVVGVKVEGPNGAYTINAKAVILATGGFASNPAMVDKYTPQWSGYPSTASVGATGDGITLATSVGAAIGNMDQASPQTVAFDTGTSVVSLTNVRYNGAILVNKEGKRFVNELSTTGPLGSAIKEQTDGGAFLLFDQAAVDNAALMQTYKDAGYFEEAGSLEDLANMIKIDAAELAKTVTAYQGFFDKGEDTEFGRKESMFSRLDKAPFYCAWITPANQTTLGGLVIDTGARVMNEGGLAIEGLYAGGETTCSGGQGITRAIVLGRLAAVTAIEDIK